MPDGIVGLNRRARRHLHVLGNDFQPSRYGRPMPPQNMWPIHFSAITHSALLKPNIGLALQGLFPTWLMERRFTLGTLAISKDDLDVMHSLTRADKTRARQRNQPKRIANTRFYQRASSHEIEIVLTSAALVPV